MPNPVLSLALADFASWVSYEIVESASLPNSLPRSSRSCMAMLLPNRGTITIKQRVCVPESLLVVRWRFFTPRSSFIVIISCRSSGGGAASLGVRRGGGAGEISVRLVFLRQWRQWGQRASNPTEASFSCAQSVAVAVRNNHHVQLGRGRKLRRD